jgi:hypothetical protein
MAQLEEIKGKHEIDDLLKKTDKDIETLNGVTAE